MLRTCEGDRVPSGEFITECLVAMPEQKKGENRARRQAERVNLCPACFGIIKPEQAHWIPSISISCLQSLRAD